MISNQIKPASIIATPAGLVMRVVEVATSDTCASVTCEFLSGWGKRTFPLERVRFLTNNERPPLRLDADYEALIASRNVAVADATVRNYRGRTKSTTKKPKTIQQRIAAAKSPEEIHAILKAAGLE